MSGAPLTVVVFGTRTVPPDCDARVVGDVGTDTSGASVARGVPSAFVAGVATAVPGPVTPDPVVDDTTAAIGVDPSEADDRSWFGLESEPVDRERDRHDAEHDDGRAGDHEPSAPRAGRSCVH